jgi:hypothetical protein
MRTIQFWEGKHMFDMLNALLPLPSDTAFGLRSLFLWVNASLLWVVVGLGFASMVATLTLHVRAEDSNQPSLLELPKKWFTRFYAIEWAPLVLATFLAVGYAMQRLGQLSPEAVAQGAIVYGLAVVGVIVAFAFHAWSMVALQSGAKGNGELKYASPAFLLTGYLSVVSFVVSIIALAGAESWAVSELTWATGFLAMFSREYCFVGSDQRIRDRC